MCNDTRKRYVVLTCTYCSGTPCWRLDNVLDTILPKFAMEMLVAAGVGLVFFVGGGRFENLCSGGRLIRRHDENLQCQKQSTSLNDPTCHVLLKHPVSQSQQRDHVLDPIVLGNPSRPQSNARDNITKANGVLQAAADGSSLGTPVVAVQVGAQLIADHIEGKVTSTAATYCGDIVGHHAGACAGSLVYSVGSVVSGVRSRGQAAKQVVQTAGCAFVSTVATYALNLAQSGSVGLNFSSSRHAITNSAGLAVGNHEEIAIGLEPVPGCGSVGVHKRNRVSSELIRHGDRHKEQSETGCHVKGFGGGASLDVGREVVSERTSQSFADLQGTRKTQTTLKRFMTETSDYLGATAWWGDSCKKIAKLSFYKKHEVEEHASSVYSEVSTLSKEIGRQLTVTRSSSDKWCFGGWRQRELSEHMQRESINASAGYLTQTHVKEEISSGVERPYLFGLIPLGPREFRDARREEWCDGFLFETYSIKQNMITIVNQWHYSIHVRCAVRSISSALSHKLLTMGSLSVNDLYDIACDDALVHFVSSVLTQAGLRFARMSRGSFSMVQEWYDMCIAYTCFAPSTIFFVRDLLTCYPGSLLLTGIPWAVDIMPSIISQCGLSESGNVVSTIVRWWNLVAPRFKAWRGGVLSLSSIFGALLEEAAGSFGLLFGEHFSAMLCDDPKSLVTAFLQPCVSAVCAHLARDTIRFLRNCIVQSQEIEAACAVLGVDSHATLSEITLAYKRRIRRMHPDRGGPTEECQRLNEAYHTIKLARSCCVSRAVRWLCNVFQGRPPPQALEYT